MCCVFCLLCVLFVCCVCYLSLFFEKVVLCVVCSIVLLSVFYWVRLESMRTALNVGGNTAISDVKRMKKPGVCIPEKHICGSSSIWCVFIYGRHSG